MKNRLTHILSALCVVALESSAIAQTPPFAMSSVESVYIRLVNATKSVESYQASAVVSERVFGARSQGSDAAYAKFMGFVARTDLTDAKPCLATLMAKQSLSVDDAAEVASIYESPLGQRLIELSQKMLKESIEQGHAVQPSAEGWSDDERRKVAAIYQTSSIRRFHGLTTQRAFMEGSLACYKSTLAAKHPDVKF